MVGQRLLLLLQHLDLLQQRVRDELLLLLRLRLLEFSDGGVYLAGKFGPQGPLIIAEHARNENNFL